MIFFSEGYFAVLPMREIISGIKFFVDPGRLPIRVFFDELFEVFICYLVFINEIRTERNLMTRHFALEQFGAVNLVKFQQSRKFRRVAV